MCVIPDKKLPARDFLNSAIDISPQTRILYVHADQWVEHGRTLQFRVTSAPLYNFDKIRICTGLISIRSAFKCAFHCQTIAFFSARFWICEYFTLD